MMTYSDINRITQNANVRWLNAFDLIVSMEYVMRFML